MVADQRMISTVESGVVATKIVIVENIRKEMLIDKAVTDGNTIMTIRHSRKAEISFGDDSATLKQCLKKFLI